MKEIALRYGCNPHQVPARVYIQNGDLPLRVLNGSPGYINLLDALNSWQLVRELRVVLDLPAAASFKHVSPSGAAVAAVPLNDSLKKSYAVDGLELSPLAEAYARARGADRMSSFGDWVALSDRVDVPVARLLSREVSDGVIAPAYEPGALKILKEKKGGKYVVLQMDPFYEPALLETREVFGIYFEQRRNDQLVTRDDFKNIVTKTRQLPETAVRDMIVAWITLKYTQSNSVCFVLDGQVIGVGAGQQSRVQCTRLAGEKADQWQMRQHPYILSLKFKPDVKRSDRDNVIDRYLRPDLFDFDESGWADVFTEHPVRFTAEERRSWLHRLTGVVLGSDAFFPFRDSIDRAVLSGVRYIIQPGGSNRDEEVIQACDEYGMSMVFSGVRLFHH